MNPNKKNPEMNSYIHGQMIFHKGPMIKSMGKELSFQQMVLGTTVYPHLKE